MLACICFAQPAAAASTPQIGLDVSYPQCGQPLRPIGPFAVVGVNKGRPFEANPCLAGAAGTSELLWAGIGAELYANTADPGPTLSSHWPNGQMEPKECNTAGSPGADTPTCAFDYGWNAAQDSYRNAVGAYIALGWAPGGATQTPVANVWWLDVETANSWEANTQNNVAELQGEYDYLRSVGAASVGFYAPTNDWQTITGSTSTFANAPAWVPGANSQPDAQARCSNPGVNGGPALVVQFSSAGFSTAGGTTDLSCVALPTLTFTAGTPSTVAVGKPSRPIEVGLPQAAATPTLVSFRANTAGGAFATSASGPWAPSLVVMVPAGAARSRAVFYTDSDKGTATIAASAAGNATATHAIGVGQTPCASPEIDHGFEIALARTRTRSTAARLVSRADVTLRSTGRRAVIEQDGCAAYELAVTGFRTRNAAKTALKRLSRAFASAAVEKT
jgi:hypothetical protein